MWDRPVRDGAMPAKGLGVDNRAVPQVSGSPICAHTLVLRQADFHLKFLAADQL